MTLKWIAVFGVLLLTAQASVGEAPVLKTNKEKQSYAAGVDMARSYKRRNVDIDVDALIKGLRDGFSGEKLLMTEEDLRAAITELHPDLKRKQTLSRQKDVRGWQALADDNKKAGDAFLAANKTKEGVVTLPSGLQYKILKVGEGKMPTETDTIEVRYRGTFINGTEFESSPADGKPATFKVEGVISGLREALKLMPVGSKWQIVIPPHLAYGPQGSGRIIGPNATLVYELELIAIK